MDNVCLTIVIMFCLCNGHRFFFLYIYIYASNVSFFLFLASRHPTVKWAQRSEELYITVELPDAQDVKVKLEPEGKFFFSATVGADKAKYEIDIDLFDKVDVNVGVLLSIPFSHFNLKYQKWKGST